MLLPFVPLILEASKINNSNYKNNCYSFIKPTGDWTEITESKTSCRNSTSILLRSNGEEVHKITFFPIIEEITHHKEHRYNINIEIDINENSFYEKYKEALNLIKKGGPYYRRGASPKRYLTEKYIQMGSVLGNIMSKTSKNVSTYYDKNVSTYYEEEFFIYTIDEMKHNGNSCIKIYAEFISPKVGKSKKDKTLKGLNLKEQDRHYTEFVTLSCLKYNNDKPYISFQEYQRISAELKPDDNFEQLATKYLLNNEIEYLYLN